MSEPAPFPDDDDALVAAVAAANLPTLLMVIVQLTGDWALLSGEIRPQRASPQKPDGGLSPEQGEQVRARALAVRGETDAAITHYRQALRIKPDFVEAHNNLGNVLAGRGEGAAAVTHYQTALAIKPDYAEAHNNLGLALADRGQLEAAAAERDRAVDPQVSTKPSADRDGVHAYQRECCAAAPSWAGSPGSAVVPPTGS